MKTFNNWPTYLKALRKRPKLAIIPVSAAAKVVNKTPRTIKNWIRDEKLKGILIAGETFVRARSLHRIVKGRKKIILDVKKCLVKMLEKGRRTVHYAEIMSEFEYDYRLSPHRDEFGWILGAVSRLSYKEMEKEYGAGNGGLLSSMVWRKDLDFVGDGYWDLIAALGFEVPSDDDAEDFVNDHINRCIEFYT